MSLLLTLFTSYYTEVLCVLIGIVLLVVLPYLYRWIKRQWRMYTCLSTLPSDPTHSHWLMGHSLLVNNIISLFYTVIAVL